MRIVWLAVLPWALWGGTAAGQDRPEVRIAVRYEVAAGVDRDAITRALRQRQAVFRHCLERAGASLPGDGRVDLRIRVDDAGRVLEAQSVGPGLDEVPRTCIEGQARRIRFPSPGTEVTARVRIDYERDGGPEAPTAREEADAALAEARLARQRGRCYLEAANRITVLSRALRAARGEAQRARLQARLAEERTRLAMCDGLLRALTGAHLTPGTGVPPG